MQVSIYAFRTLLWGSQQNLDDLRDSTVPEAVLPVLERETTHAEMVTHGWLHEAARDEMLGGSRNFVLSPSGKLQARRWLDEYAVHSAAYEFLQAIPTASNMDLTSAEDAFDTTYRDPVTGEMPSAEIIDQAGTMLNENKLISGVEFLGSGAPLRMQLTQQGRNVRTEHYVPTLITEMPDSSLPATAAIAPATTYNYNATFNAGTYGAVQFGNQNHAAIENVQSEIQQHFQTLHDLASEAPPQDRQALLEQIEQLEEAAQQGPSAFEDLRNKFFSGLITKLGDRSVEALMAIPPLLTALGS